MTTLSLLVVVGCASPPPKPSLPAVQIDVPATAKVEPPTPARTPVHITAVNRPAGASIDGDLGEWGPLAGPGGSHLAFALDNDALLLAADLDEGARDGIRLALATTPPGVLGIDVGDCVNKNVEQDGATEQEPLSASEAAACRAVVDAHKTFEENHKKRFARRFQIDREGVRGIQDSGELVPIAGAKAVWKADSKGARVEVSLPLLALPRFSAAPLTWLGAWACAATSPLPEMAAEDAKVLLPSPLSFEPYGEIRARVFEQVKKEFLIRWNMPYPTVGQSYQPGDALHIESMDYGDSRVIVNVGELFEKKASLGTLEVGYVHAFWDSLAILHQDKLKVLFEPNDCASEGIGREDLCGCEGKGQWRGVVTREGAVHAFLFHEGSFATSSCGVQGARGGGWSVLEIAPDGTSRQAAYETVSSTAASCDKLYCACKAGVGTANEALDTFQWSGECIVRKSTYEASAEKSMRMEVSYRWDRAKKKYLVTWRSTPVPPAPKK